MSNKKKNKKQLRGFISSGKAIKAAIANNNDIRNLTIVLDENMTAEEILAKIEEEKKKKQEELDALKVEFDEKESQFGNLIMMHTVLAMCANACIQKAAINLAKYGKIFDRQAKQDYNDIIRMSSKIRELYDKIRHDAIPAIETDGKNDFADKYDSIQEAQDIMLPIVEATWAAENKKKGNAQKILEYARKRAEGEVFLNDEMKEGIIRF